MKTCAICTTNNDHDAPTCAACGEATWSFESHETPTTRRTPVRPVVDESAARRAVKDIQARRGAREPS